LLKLLLVLIIAQILDKFKKLSCFQKILKLKQLVDCGFILDQYIF